MSADVGLLFTLLDHVDSRWALFAAYERYPKTFRRHIEAFGAGRITEAEYCEWLQAQGLVLTSRGLRFAAPDRG